MSGDVFTEDEMLISSGPARLTRLPTLLVTALRLVRDADQRLFRVAVTIQVLASAGLAVQLLLSKLLLDELLVDGAVLLSTVLWLAAFLTLTTFVLSVMNQFRAEQQRLLGIKVEQHTARQIIQTACDAHLLAFDDAAFHNQLLRARSNAATRPVAMVNGLLVSVNSALAIAGVGLAILTLEPVLIGVLLIGFLPILAVNRFSSRIIYRFTVEQTERDRRRAYLYFLLTGRESAAELRAYRLANSFARQHDVLFEERISDLRVAARKRLLAGSAGAAINALMFAVVLVLLVLFIQSGRVDVAEAATITGALLLVRSRMQALLNGSSSLYENALFLEDFTTFVVSDHTGPPRGSKTLPDPPQAVELVDVTFAYPGKRQPAVQHISMELRSGEVVALVGENGSGKSTLAKLVAGLYSPQDGTVLWDGMDTMDWSADSLREHVGVAFQDFARFFLSAQHNIAVGHDDPDLADVRRAAELGGASDFIESLPAGYDTLLGAEYFGGTDLSGGQWQRIALARAFFRDAPIVILDEPSAALDPRAEFALFERVARLQADRTVLLISHRLANVRSADRIYVLHDGRIIETGSHEDLMANGGHYAELFRLQATSYDDTPSDTSGEYQQDC